VHVVELVDVGVLGLAVGAAAQPLAQRKSNICVV